MIVVPAALRAVVLLQVVLRNRVVAQAAPRNRVQAAPRNRAQVVQIHQQAQAAQNQVVARIGNQYKQ